MVNPFLRDGRETSLREKTVFDGGGIMNDL